MSAEPQPIRLSPIGKPITIAIIITLALLLIRGLGPVATPFIAAGITAYLFNPLITWLHHRTKVGRGAWIGLLYLILGLLIYLLVRFIGPIIAGEYRELVRTIPTLIKDLREQLQNNATINLGGLQFNAGPADQSLTALLSEIGRQIPAQAPRLFATVIETLLLFVSYLMVTYYLLDQADRVMEWIYGLVPAPYRAEIRTLGQQIDAVLAGYVRGTLLLVPIMAVMLYIALLILGVRYALILAIISGFLEIIPLIGPWSAAGITIIVSLFQVTTAFGWPHWLLAGVIGLVYFVLRILEDNFIIPRIVGGAVHLHPMLVIFAILAGGALGGAFGLFVAIPVAGVLRILLRYFYYKLIDQDPPTSEAHGLPPVPEPHSEPAPVVEPVDISAPARP
ncbi:MAG: AI-2E family transporter [Roseiflexaceae bacterium]|nr:AI-2E family transporter [Roseiflexaceae bacterium]